MFAVFDVVVVGSLEVRWPSSTQPEPLPPQRPEEVSPVRQTLECPPVRHAHARKTTPQYRLPPPADHASRERTVRKSRDDLQADPRRRGAAPAP